MIMSRMCTYRPSCFGWLHYNPSHNLSWEIRCDNNSTDLSPKNCWKHVEASMPAKLVVRLPRPHTYGFGQVQQYTPQHPHSVHSKSCWVYTYTHTWTLDTCQTARQWMLEIWLNGNACWDCDLGCVILCKYNLGWDAWSCDFVLYKRVSLVVL